MTSYRTMGTDQEPLTFSVIEAARLLRISRGTAYEAVRTGQLPSVRFGRVIRVPRYALEQLLRQQAADVNVDGVSR